jgi:hypothetical protein
MNMYAILAGIGITLLLMILEVFCNVPTVSRLFAHAENLRSRGAGRAYLAILVTYPLAVVAAAYGLATVAGLYFGFAQAWYDVGTAFAMIIFVGIVGCFFSFLGDVGSLAASKLSGKQRRGKPEVRLLTTIVFVSGMYGSLVVCILKMNGVLDAAL